ncbi:MAG: hypothetical protein QOF78_2727 [Phycisphaerales bacterium]|jgi:hypothetical protein|nr:hypothetical protein [Phycisphaerales bacterium]MEA2734490.1 hypothetical protein [Humisphaera sp.]
MRKLLLIAAVFCLTAGVNFGCNKNKSDNADGDPMKMSTQDDCAMCPGVQKATADGKCPKCAMKVKG